MRICGFVVDTGCQFAVLHRNVVLRNFKILQSVVVLCADLGRFLSISLDEISIDLRSDVIGFVSADRKWCWSTAGSSFLGEEGQKYQGGHQGVKKAWGISEG